MIKNNRGQTRKDLPSVILLTLLFVSISLVLYSENIIKEERITGLAVYQETYSKEVNLTFNQTQEINVTLKPNITSLSLSGYIVGDGYIDVYLKKDNETLYKVFGRELVEKKGLEKITGKVTEEDIEELFNVTDTTEEVTGGEYEPENPPDNAYIDAVLSYNFGTDYDYNDDGIESTVGIIDYSVSGEFNWNVDYDKLCVRWETFDNYDLSLEVVCYGNDMCCNFVGLMPTSAEWNDVFYSYYGRYGTGKNNTISAQILYIDYDLTVPYSYVVYSNWSSLRAVYLEELVERISFMDVCLESCSFELENDENYTILVEIRDDTRLVIEEIKYNAPGVPLVRNETLKHYKAVINSPVKWQKRVKLSKESNVSIEIPEEAVNVTVEKVVEHRRVELENVSLVKEGRKVSLITGYAIYREESEIIVDENVTDVLIEYYLPGPTAVEQDINEFTKRVTVSSDIHYKDVLAYTYLPTEASVGAVHLYRLVNGSRIEVECDKYDTNNDSLVDYIEWIVPSLSSEEYEIRIEILNVHSYPSLYGNWTVMFNTTGIANLTITATRESNYTEEYTRWHNESEDSGLYDLKFLEISCGNKTLEYEWQGTNCNENECSVFIKDYSCNETGYEISKVLTPKRHALLFNFGGQEAYAYNAVANITIDFVSPTPNNDTTTKNTSVEINISITDAEELDGFVWGWNNTNYVFYDENLVLMMNFDNVSAIGDNSTYVVDVSKYGNNGTIYDDSNYNFTDAKIGGALTFDGDGDYVSVADSTTLNMREEITLMAWIYQYDYSGDIWKRIISKEHWDAGNINDAYNLVMSGDSKKPVMTIYIDQTEYKVWPDYLMPNRTWVHVAGTYNGSQMTIYINGQLNNITSDVTGLIDVSTLPLEIGTESSFAYADFTGMIDDVAIYNRSLSEAEIEQHYYSSLYKYDTDKWQFYSRQNGTNESGLNEGTHTYQGQVKDSARNWNSTDLRYLTVDTTAPDITIIRPQNTSYNDNITQWINVTATEDISVWIINWNGTNMTWANSTNPSLANRTFTFNESQINLTIYANDTANNWDWENITFLIDVTQPVLEDLSLSGTSGYSGTAIIIYANCSDTFSGVDYVYAEVLDPNKVKVNYTMSINESRYNKSYTPGSVGTYNFSFYCADKAGNQVSNLSTGLQFEASAITITVTQSALGSGGGGGAATVIASISLKAPKEPVKISAEKPTTIPIKIKNTGDVNIRNLKIDLTSDSKNIALSSDHEIIEILNPNEEKEIRVNIKPIKPSVGIENYTITLKVNTTTPKLESFVKFYVNLAGKNYTEKIRTDKEVRFAKDLFKENPECAEFTEIIEQAKTSYEEGDYNKAITLINVAIQACRDRTSPKEKEYFAPEERTSLVIFFVEMFVLILLITLMATYYKKRKIRRKIMLRMKKEAAKGEQQKESKAIRELEFENLLRDTELSIKQKNIEKAREGYLKLLDYYKSIIKSDIEHSKKQEYYNMLIEVRKSIFRMLK